MTPNRYINTLFLLVSLFIVSGSQLAAQVERGSISLQYTSADKKVFTAIVPKAMTDRTITMPIQVSDTTRWIVRLSVEQDHKTFNVHIDDTTFMLANPESAHALPVAIFDAAFDVVYGKPITVFKSTAGVLEITISTE